MHKKLIVILASIALLATVCSTTARNMPTQANNPSTALTERNIPSTNPEISFRELYYNTRSDLAFVKRYQSSEIASHFDLSMIGFLKEAQNALSARLNFLNSQGLECIELEPHPSCPARVRSIITTFKTSSQYQLDQNQLEYVKQAWFSIDRDGRGYWYPIGMGNNRYYYNFENGMIVDTATFVFTPDKRTLTIQVDTLRESDVFLTQRDSNPNLYEGTVDHRYSTKFSRIKSPFNFV